MFAPKTLGVSPIEQFGLLFHMTQSQTSLHLLIVIHSRVVLSRTLVP